VTFAAPDLTDDGFLGGRLRILQPREGYRAATDPVLLAAATDVRAGQSVLELGCGAAVALLCLGSRVPGLRLSGVERQPAYAALARANAARNGLALDVVEGDLAEMPADLRRAFDHVIANPPYHPPGRGTAARDPGREAALRQDTPLAVWIDAATRRLAPRGWLTLIQDSAQLPAVLRALDDRMGSVSVLPLCPRAGRPATRVLLRACKGGRGAFRLLAPLVLHEGPAHRADGDDFTPELQSVLRDGTALFSRFG
jgi:tRNA1(Val) A37 N6-methylase TrmN6